MHKIAVFYQQHKKLLKSKDIKNVISHILMELKIKNCEINIIFVDSQYIQDLNQQYFEKATPTDVISFSLTETPEPYLEGEVYVCVEMAQKQAEEYQISLENELFRLVIHGVLHLSGYDDQSPVQKEQMTAKEDEYLAWLEQN
ncbi:rRNA maturation RNase YbeY [candidate division KSB1 bacterium]|nr:rRNA maturation RNase YbeY [candidate division KSB1 bacterium]